MKSNKRVFISIASIIYAIAVIMTMTTSCNNNSSNSNEVKTDLNKFSSAQAYAHYLESSKNETMKTVEQIKINPDPYKPYNLAQGYKVDNILYISGQAAYGEDGNLIGINSFDLQAEQTFKNLKRVLEAGGSSLENVIKVTIFLKDMGNFEKIVALREKYFTPPYPADTIVEISSLYSPDALI
jgi:reactive intermediate/imine deaminase